jgi:hypothetical protein
MGDFVYMVLFLRRGDTDGGKWRNVIQKLLQLGEACKAAKLQRYKTARMQDSKKYWRNIGALGTRKQKEVGGERRSKEKQKVARETKA